MQRELALQFCLPAGTHRVEPSWPTRDAGQPQTLDLPFTPRSPFRNFLSGFESNRVVKQQRLLTRESESSKGLLPGCEANPHGWLRDPESKFLETKTRALGSESSQTLENPGL